MGISPTWLNAEGARLPAPMQTRRRRRTRTLLPRGRLGLRPRLLEIDMVSPPGVGPRLTPVGPSWPKRLSHNGNGALRNGCGEPFGDKRLDGGFDKIISTCVCFAGGVIVIRVRGIDIGLCTSPVAPMAVAFRVLSEPLLVQVVHPTPDQAEIVDLELAQVWIVFTIRLSNLCDPSKSRGGAKVVPGMRRELGVSLDEHERRLRGLNQFPKLPRDHRTERTERPFNRNSDMEGMQELHPVQAKPARDLIKAAGKTA